MRLIDADELLEDIHKCCGMKEELRETECFCGIKNLVEKQPTFDIEKVIGQYKWERDMAMYQLEQLGIGFGQKLEDEVIEKVKEVIRCD